MVTKMDNAKPENRLAFLRGKLNLPGPIEQAGLVYDQCPTQNTLIRLLRSDPYQDDQVVSLSQVLDSCSRNEPCRLSVCRKCGDGMKRRQLKSNLKCLFAAVGERPPQQQLAWLTINYGWIDATSKADCAVMAKKFRKSLANTFDRHLPDHKAVGDMDVSDDCLLHAHILVWHRDLDVTHLAAKLRKVFTRPRAVHVTNWYVHQDHKVRDRIRLAEKTIALDDLNLMKVMTYGIKVLPELTFNPDGRLLHKEDTAEVVGQRLLGLQHIRGNGMRGGRIRVGVSRPEWKWHRDLLVHKETGEYQTILLMTELLRRKRTGRETEFIEQKKLEQQQKRLMRGLKDRASKRLEREQGMGGTSSLLIQDASKG